MSLIFCTKELVGRTHLQLSCLPYHPGYFKRIKQNRTVVIELRLLWLLYLSISLSKKSEIFFFNVKRMMKIIISCWLRFCDCLKKCNFKCSGSSSPANNYRFGCQWPLPAEFGHSDITWHPFKLCEAARSPHRL